LQSAKWDFILIDSQERTGSGVPGCQKRNIGMRKLVFGLYISLLITPSFSGNMNAYPDIDPSYTTCNRSLDSIIWSDSAGRIFQRCLYAYRADTVFQTWYDSTNRNIGTQRTELNPRQKPVRSFGIDGALSRFYYADSLLDSICISLTPQNQSCFVSTKYNRNVFLQADSIYDRALGSITKYVQRFNSNGDVLSRSTYYDGTLLLLNQVFYDYQNNFAYDTCKSFNNQPSYVRTLTFNGNKLMSRKCKSLTGNPLHAGLGFADVNYFYNSSESITSTYVSRRMNNSDKICGIFTLSGRAIPWQQAFGKMTPRIVLVKYQGGTTKKLLQLGANSRPGNDFPK
jgi:hypothetical protein